MAKFWWLIYVAPPIKLKNYKKKYLAATSVDMGYGKNRLPTAETLPPYGLGELVPDLAISTSAPTHLMNESLAGKKHP